MKKNKIIAPIVLVLLVAVGVVAWQKRSVRVPMRLELTGTKGLKVAGKVIVDGVRGGAADPHHSWSSQF